MNQAPKRRMRVLAAASLLATGGLICLVVASWGMGSEWLRAGLASPVAVRSLLWILGGMTALGVLVAIMIRMRPERLHGQPRFLHGDQDGTAAIEMVLVLPLALMVVLIVTQAALLFNANMVVNYAAYAAGREACVALSLPLGREARNLVNNPDYPLAGGSAKLELIHRAAALALMPISGECDTPPGDTSGNDLEVSDYVDPGGKIIADRTRALFDSLNVEARPWLRRVEKKYNYAARYSQITLAQPVHWRDGNPDPDCPYRNQKQDDWTQWGWTYLPFCPYFPERMDYYKWEDLHVRVIYQFLLDVPYAGRFMGRPAAVPGYSGTAYQAEIHATNHVMNEGGPDPQPTS